MFWKFGNLIVQQIQEKWGVQLFFVFSFSCLELTLIMTSGFEKVWFNNSLIFCNDWRDSWKLFLYWGLLNFSNILVSEKNQVFIDNLYYFQRPQFYPIRVHKISESWAENMEESFLEIMGHLPCKPMQPMWKAIPGS